MCRGELSAVIVQLMSSACEAGGSVSVELKKFPSLSSAVLWFVNGHERKPSRQKKKKNHGNSISPTPPSLFSEIVM